jgi:hypothetical protein
MCQIITFRVAKEAETTISPSHHHLNLTSTEEALVEMRATVLYMNRESFTRNSDFIQLGGDSVLLIRRQNYTITL